LYDYLNCMRMRRSRRHGMRDGEHVGGRDRGSLYDYLNCMRMRRSRRHGMCDGEHVGGGDEDPGGQQRNLGHQEPGHGQEVSLCRFINQCYVY
jgi:hypothetical protein